jgi:RimJ/RimL family protein N-acetyltransferase
MICGNRPTENYLPRMKAPGHAPPVGHILQTERLELRRFTADDAELLIELDSDPAVMRYLTGGEPENTPDVIRERVLPSIVAGYERWGGNFGLFAAYELDGGVFIGWFCLRPELDAPTDEVELGYRLRRQAWGNGYATEGSRALLEKAFTELDVRSVWGATMSTNLPSQKVMEKVGMQVAKKIATPEDMREVEGSELGGLQYEITKEQWEQQHEGRERGPATTSARRPNR